MVKLIFKGKEESTSRRNQDSCDRIEKKEKQHRGKRRKLHIKM